MKFTVPFEAAKTCDARDDQIITLGTCVLCLPWRNKILRLSDRYESIVENVLMATCNGPIKLGYFRKFCVTRDWDEVEAVNLIHG